MVATPTFSAPLGGGHLTQQSIQGAFAASKPTQQAQRSYADAALQAAGLRPPRPPGASAPQWCPILSKGGSRKQPIAATTTVAAIPPSQRTTTALSLERLAGVASAIGLFVFEVVCVSMSPPCRRSH